MTVITGDTVIVNKELKDDYEATVYVTEYGEKYHREWCRYLGDSKIPLSKGEAIAQGYEPCSVCDP